MVGQLLIFLPHYVSWAASTASTCHLIVSYFRDLIPHRSITNKSILTTAISLLFLALASMLWRMRKKRIQKLRSDFQRRLPPLRKGAGQNQLAYAIGKLRAAEIAMIAARNIVLGLAPQIPSLDKDSDDSAALCKQMMACIERDIKSITGGTIGVLLSRILDDAGYPFPELLPAAIKSVEPEFTKHPERLLKTMKPFLVNSPGAPSKSNTDVRHHVFEMKLHTDTPNGSSTEGSVDRTATAPSANIKGASFPSLTENIPIVSLVRSLFRHSGRALNGKISMGRAAEHIGTDVVTTFTGSLLGTVLIPIPFVGTTIGTRVTRLAGKHFKTRRFREARRIYDEAFASARIANASSIREIYRAYRDKCIEANVRFRPICGNVILPSETAELVSLITAIHVSLLREEQNLSRELENIGRLILDNHTVSWIDKIFGLSITHKARRLLRKDIEDAFAGYSSLYNGLNPGELGNMELLERTTVSAFLPAGIIDQCLMQSSASISAGIATQLRLFVNWSTIAIAVKVTFATEIRKLMDEQSERHSKSMEPVIKRLKELEENLRREAEALE